MFDTLTASHAARAPMSRVAAAALLLHVLGVAAAVHGTAAPLDAARALPRDTIHLHVLPQAEPSPSKLSSSPIPPAPAMPQPPRLPYPAPGVPELQLPSLSFNPVDVARGEQPPPAGDARSAGPPATDRRFTATEVDVLPELATQLRPGYPEGLRHAGLEGWVELEYVVGKEGQVDRGSLRVVGSSHPGFVPSALESARGARFKPGRRGGEPVAVLVRQTIRFRLR